MIDYPTTLSKVKNDKKRTELCGAEVSFLIMNADMSFLESACISCTAGLACVGADSF